MNTVIADANVILRYLLDDHAQFSPPATGLFEAAERGEVTLVIDPVVVAECCYVLQGRVYGFPRDLIAEHLTLVIVKTGVQCEPLSVVLGALESYTRDRVDFADAYLATLAKVSNASLATFDQRLRNLGGPLHPLT